MTHEESNNLHGDVDPAEDELDRYVYEELTLCRRYSVVVLSIQNDLRVIVLRILDGPWLHTIVMRRLTNVVDISHARLNSDLFQYWEQGFPPITFPSTAFLKNAVTSGEIFRIAFPDE